MSTIRDVASHAGVSQATASRALSRRGPVSPDSLERVRAAAQALGYRVNKNARALRTQRTDTIGLLIPDVRNPFFAELAYVIHQAAATHGLGVITMSADEEAEQEARGLDVLLRQQVDGLIVCPRDDVPFLAARHLPVVFVDRGRNGLGVPVIRSDDEAGAALMIDHLMAVGHRHIALITGPQESTTGRARYKAALQRLAHHDVSPLPQWVQEGDFRLESGRRAAAALLDAPELPTAVFAGDNLMAVGALLEMRERGLRVGRDIALTAFDDAPWFPLLDPPLTVVAQDARRLGQEALESLLCLLAGHEATDVVVPVCLKVRSSCTVTSVLPATSPRRKP